MLDSLQSVLNPQGADAFDIAEIAWVLIVGGAAIFVFVMALLAWALFAPPRLRTWLSRRDAIVAGGAVFPLVSLTALLVYTLMAMASIPEGDGAEPLRIEVVGEQWWWRVHYLDDEGRRDFATANEIRIPVGRPVEFALVSADVIHSFWVPSLAGKLDMIPGRTNHLRVTALHAGRFRGQCAEFCGGPHAQMALFVIAEAPERFEVWSEQQRRPAAALDAPGKATFESRCAVCHTVRGTNAAGLRGPDLTHVGSRVSLGAGILPNNAGTFAAWIASNQHLKPGNLMPSFEDFEGEELRALAVYLESLH